MNDSAGKSTSDFAYEAPELEIHPLAAIVMAGATGGGDSGFTEFDDGQGGGGQSSDDPIDDDPFRNDW